MFMRVRRDIKKQPLPMGVYEKAATAAGWAHAGDFDGFWYDAKRFNAWKAAAHEARCGRTYETARQVCEGEHISI